jgi:hypothetical protein
MQYKDQLRKRISEIELEIANNSNKKFVLEKELQDLLKKEFEESLVEESERQILLKG